MAAAILNKWDKFPGEQKIAFHDTADAAVIHRLNRKAVAPRTRDLYKSIDLASDAIRRLFKTYQTSSDKISPLLEEDPVKLRDAAKVLRRTAKGTVQSERHKLRTPSNRYSRRPRNCNQYWGTIGLTPSGICLCWMSYPALAKFLCLTCFASLSL